MAASRSGRVKPAEPQWLACTESEGACAHRLWAWPRGNRPRRPCTHLAADASASACRRASTLASCCWRFSMAAVLQGRSAAAAAGQECVVSSLGPCRPSRLATAMQPVPTGTASGHSRSPVSLPSASLRPTLRPCPLCPLAPLPLDTHTHTHTPSPSCPPLQPRPTWHPALPAAAAPPCAPA